MRAIQWAILIAGVLLLVFGLGCLNYTKIGGVEHHREVAQQHGWPAPNVAIAHVGMLSAPLGAGAIGFVAGRAKRQA
jgi:hypothetical protein